MSDQTIQTIIPCILNLEILKVTGCYRCNDISMAELVRAISKTLKHLDVSNNSRFGQELIGALVENCKEKLESLNIDHSLQVTGEMIQRLECLKKLRNISISHIQDVNDEDINIVLKGIGRQLKGISVAGCHQLTDQTLINIRENCREIGEIDLSSIPNFTKIGRYIIIEYIIYNLLSRSIHIRTCRLDGFICRVEKREIHRRFLAHN